MIRSDKVTHRAATSRLAVRRCRTAAGYSVGNAGYENHDD